MKKFYLVIVTENQKTLEKAQRVAHLVCKILECENDFKISKYNKFKNSYKIEIIGKIPDNLDPISKSVELTNRIGRPWLITYNEWDNDISLTFVKSEAVFYEELSFNVIRWANFETEDCQNSEFTEK